MTTKRQRVVLFFLNRLKSFFDHKYITKSQKTLTLQIAHLTHF